MTPSILKEPVGLLIQRYSKIKDNVFLVDTAKRKLILKGRRDKANILNYIRFKNEQRIYSHLSKNKTSFLKIAEFLKEYSREVILIEYLQGTSQESFRQEECFTTAYIELQHQKFPEKPFLDFLNQLFRGYHYKVCGVAIFTISRRIGSRISYKIIRAFMELHSTQQNLKGNTGFTVIFTIKTFFLDPEG